MSTITEQREVAERKLQNVPVRRRIERIEAVHELASIIEQQARIWRDRCAYPEPSRTGLEELAASCEALAAGIRVLK